MTYEEALEKGSKVVFDGIPYGGYEDEDGYYFKCLPKEEYELGNKNKFYSEVVEYGIYKKTGEIMKTDIVLFYTICYPDKLDSIENSMRRIKVG